VWNEVGVNFNGVVVHVHSVPLWLQECLEQSVHIYCDACWL